VNPTPKYDISAPAGCESNPPLWENPTSTIRAARRDKRCEGLAKRKFARAEKAMGLDSTKTALPNYMENMVRVIYIYGEYIMSV